MPAKKRSTKKPPAASFEEAAEELELITQRLEEEPSSLEKLLADFERGQALLSYCQKTLQSARKRLDLVEANLKADLQDDQDAPNTDFTDDQDDDVRLF